MKRILLRRHKNSRFLYYVGNIQRLLTPAPWYRRGLPNPLLPPAGPEREEIRARVEHAYRRRGAFALPAAAAVPGIGLLAERRNYAFDLLEHTRRFPAGLRVAFRFGDETTDPGAPTLVKARCIAEPSAHSVLFPLNKVRHFVFVRDELAFADKADRLVWRGAAQRPWRQEFLRRHIDHPLCDVGCTDERPANAAWRRPYLSMGEQLRYKFVLSIEGIDVATNLKWILSSNSLCVMARPKRESWFMEGRLVPGEHFVCVRDDHADLAEQLERYLGDPAAAGRMLRAAQDHAARFLDPRREAQVAALVLARYAHDSGQAMLPRGGRAALEEMGWW